MTRQIPMDRPLSDEDRAYMLMRGDDSRVAYLDAQFPADAEDSEPDDGGADSGAELPDDYNKWPKKELEAEVAARNEKFGAGIVVVGTGANGAVKVADYATALQVDDATRSE